MLFSSPSGQRSSRAPARGALRRTVPRVAIVGGPDVDARLEFIRHLKPDFDVCVLGSRPGLAAAFEAEGVPYHAYRLARRVNPVADGQTVRDLVRLFRAVRPDLVHTFDTKPGVWGCLAARWAGVPVVVATVTGLGALYAQRGVKTRVVRGIYEALQRLACRLADQTVFQNGADAEQFVASRIAPAEKCLVIPGSGVATAWFDPAAVPRSERERCRAELGIPRDALVVAMVARVIRSKGVLEFMQAARLVSQHRPGVVFLLVGAADEESEDRLNPGELRQLRQTVVCPGARRDIRTVLAGSDLFTLPSAYREGVPRVLLEAAAMGLPIITTDTPGCNEVVADGKNGLLVPPNDAPALARAVIRLVDEPALCRQFGHCSRRRAVALFDMAIVAGQTRSLYERLLCQKGRLIKRESILAPTRIAKESPSVARDMSS